MNLIHEPIKSIYRKFLIPSLGSAMVMSIYTMADAIVIGKGVGANALAALSLTTPCIAVLMSTGIMFGVGGSIHMGVQRGMENNEEANNFFTVSCLLIGSVILLLWLLYGLNIGGILRLTGANDALFPYAFSYMKWIVRLLPIVVLSNFLAILIRNDNDPNRALFGVISGGVVNIFLDIYLVMYKKVGIEGAAIASVTGMVVSSLVMASHFISKKNTLSLCRPRNIPSRTKSIITSGISSFLNEFSNGLIVCLFNIQVLRYCGETALSVYGVISNCVILFNSLFTGVGQAIQPILSTNFGAEKMARIKECRRLGFVTILVMGSVFSLSGILFPHMVAGIFLKLTPEIKAASSLAIRLYFLAFLPAGLNLLATYYLQSVLKTGQSLFLSMMRNIVLSSVLLLTLPLFLPSAVLWLCMPITEGILLLFTLFFVYSKSQRISLQ